MQTISRKAAKAQRKEKAGLRVSDSVLSRLSPRTWMLLVAFAAVALYLPTLGYDFVYDSATQIGTDDFIHQPRHFFDVLTLRVLGMDVLDFNRPVNLFTLMVDSLLWGKNPAGYRLTSLLLHGATVALLFRWLRIMTGKLWPALLAALVFAVHPLHTETVVEVGYREDLLATLFLLLGMNAAAAFQPGEKGKTWGPAILAVASLFLSAASKESGIVGPVLLAAFWWFFRRDRQQDRRAWLLLFSAATVAVGTFFALRFSLEPNPSVIFSSPPPPLKPILIDRLLTEATILTGELLRFVWPADLCADYGPYNLRNIDQTWAAYGILALGIVQIALSIWNRKAAFANVLIWGALLPVCNLVPIYHGMADRYLYMPMAGVALLLALALAGIRSVAWRDFGVVSTTGAIIALIAATLQQQTNWQDATTLWRVTSQQNPYSYGAWLGRGYASLDRNQSAEAIQHFQHALNTLIQCGADPARLPGEPFAAIALAADALGQRRLAGEALARATKLDSRYAKPDTLVRALVFPDYMARRLAIIAKRSSLP